MFPFCEAVQLFTKSQYHSVTLCRNEPTGTSNISRVSSSANFGYTAWFGCTSHFIWKVNSMISRKAVMKYKVNCENLLCWMKTISGRRSTQFLNFMHRDQLDSFLDSWSFIIHKKLCILTDPLPQAVVQRVFYVDLMVQVKHNISFNMIFWGLFLCVIPNCGWFPPQHGRGHCLFVKGPILFISNCVQIHKDKRKIRMMFYKYM